MANWQVFSDLWNQGSFVSQVPAPNTDPGDTPLLCVQFNSAWLPYILGSMFQLTQPSAWDATSAGYADVLEQAQALMAIFSGAEDCTYMLTWNFTDTCILQYSVDGGETWIDVPGWAEFAPACFTGPEGPAGPPGTYTPGTPSNPQDVSTPQLACDIAGFIATQVIKSALDQTVSAIEASQSLYQAGLAVLGILIGPDPVLDVVLVAANYLYGRIAGGTIGDYTAALADDTLWGDVTCAIYTATSGDGYVTAANFAAVVAAVGAISYTYPDVITSLVGYLEGLGATGVMALQIPGAMAAVDCSGCGTWCWEWDFTEAPGPFMADSGNGTWVSGQGWTSVDGGGFPALVLIGSWPAVNVTRAQMFFTTLAVSGGANRVVDLRLSGSTVQSDALDTGINFPTPAEYDAVTVPTIDGVYAYLDSLAGTTDGNVILSFRLVGNGPNPFGETNCSA